MQNEESWHTTLARLRAAAARPLHGKGGVQFEPALEGLLGKEAVMTLVSIMKESEDPKLQIAAAKTLLQRSKTVNADTVSTDRAETATSEMSLDECDAAIAVAKALLDELARRKTAGLSGARELGSESAS